MPDSNSAHEPSVGPQATMSLREIAEAFVKDPDADLVGVIYDLLKLRRMRFSTAGGAAHGLAEYIINHVEG